jgi:acetyltransferase-like isoleucine patch superfamily enzyme
MDKKVKKIKLYLKNAFMMRKLVQLMLAGVVAGRDVRVYGRLQVHSSPGCIVLSERVTLNASNRRNTLEARGPVVLKTLNRRARIRIGTDSGLTSATISAAQSIDIGDRVLIGAGVLITDSDHHVVRPPTGQVRRHLGLPEARPSDGVRIEDDVFVGARSIVLKGVTIGRGSVIGAGSVVTTDIPPMVIAAGNPCRVIKALEPGYAPGREENDEIGGQGQ